MKKYKLFEDNIDEKQLLGIALALSGILKFIRDPDYMLNIEDQLRKWTQIVESPKYQNIVKRYSKWLKTLK